MDFIVVDATYIEDRLIDKTNRFDTAYGCGYHNISKNGQVIGQVWCDYGSLCIFPYYMVLDLHDRNFITDQTMFIIDKSCFHFKCESNTVLEQIGDDDYSFGKYNFITSDKTTEIYKKWLHITGGDMKTRIKCELTMRIMLGIEYNYERDEYYDGCISERQRGE